SFPHDGTPSNARRQDFDDTTIGQRVAMYGIRLMRIARICKAAKSMNSPVAVSHGTVVRQRSAETIPTAHDPPITTVIATSMGLNVPLIRRAHRSRNSQMTITIASQKMKHGSAAHFASSRR